MRAVEEATQGHTEEVRGAHEGREGGDQEAVGEGVLFVVRSGDVPAESVSAEWGRGERAVEGPEVGVREAEEDLGVGVEEAVDAGYEDGWEVAEL